MPQSWILLRSLCYAGIISGILACSGDSTTTKDCRAIKDYYNPDIVHFECPDGTNYSSNMAAGIVEGDIVDLKTQVDIVNVK